MLDVGCGTGYHVRDFATTARSVLGVEPHPDLAALARRRNRRAEHVEIRIGVAAELPVADHSIDVVHARWAYFFGPGCEPGLAELDRVLRPGGVAVLIDNDGTRSTFGGWFASGFPSVDPAANARFWAAHGWSRERVTTSWDFTDRGELEAVVRMELPGAVAEQALASHTGTTVDYAVNVWWKGF